MTGEPIQDAGRILFPTLAKRGIAPSWATLPDPVAALHAECASLEADDTFRVDLREYLQKHPIIQASTRSMLAQLAFSAGSRWQETAPVLQPLSRRGWHISRWLPTFLLIDGPLGRLMNDRASPLTIRMRGRDTGLRLLSETRDAFSTRLFRDVRNGFAHWAFEWLERSPVAEIRIVDWESGRETARLSLLECEALHHLTVSTVNAIDERLFSQARP